jgi:hypothetical protein
MRHLQEQELIEYRYGDLPDTAAAAEVEQHLHECEACRVNFEALKLVLAAVDTDTVPERGANFETRIWAAIAPRLEGERAAVSQAGEKGHAAARWFGWRDWLTVRRIAAVGAFAAMLLAAFLAGRYMSRNGSTSSPMLTVDMPAPVPPQGRDRVLLMAVGDHLDRAQMVLMEISNTETDGTGAKAQPAETNITHEQKRAEELLAENRIYRQTAEHRGENGVASVLDELEPVLMEIAHSPSDVTPSELAELQKHIASRGLMLKIRVLDSTVREREKKAPAASGASMNGL